MISCCGHATSVALPSVSHPIPNACRPIPNSYIPSRANQIHAIPIPHSRDESRNGIPTLVRHSRIRIRQSTTQKQDWTFHQ
jgi:hypothetical protein